MEFYAKRVCENNQFLQKDKGVPNGLQDSSRKCSAWKDFRFEP